MCTKIHSVFLRFSTANMMTGYAKSQTKYIIISRIKSIQPRNCYRHLEVSVISYTHLGSQRPMLSVFLRGICSYMFVSCRSEQTFCEIQRPCQNGGTCIDRGEDNYLCVCPKCNCSDAEPFDNCTIGKCVRLHSGSN